MNKPYDCDECWDIDDDSPEPPEKAHWITHGDYERYECSRCGEDSAYSRARNPWRTTYCPHCGASMKG